MHGRPRLGEPSSGAPGLDSLLFLPLPLPFFTTELSFSKFGITFVLVDFPGLGGGGGNLPASLSSSSGGKKIWSGEQLSLSLSPHDSSLLVEVEYPLHRFLWLLLFMTRLSAFLANFLPPNLLRLRLPVAHGIDRFFDLVRSVVV